jgi:ADP-L-glycero-D-manno-heptose 6-epimerase
MFWMMQEAFAGKSETANVKEATDNNFTFHVSRFTNGIYNVGTGKARSFNALVKATFAAMDMDAQIKYIDMPEDIRDKYQYFTEAKIEKLRLAGYTSPLHTLEEGVFDYLKNYLLKNRYH